MNRLARLTLVFALLFAFFIVAPAFLSRQFPLYPLMKWGDVLDVFTPLVLIPLYWLLFQVSPDRAPKAREITFFLVLVALWVEGQGMHLSGNSIGHLLKELKDSDVYALTNFYDEVLSHYLWHIGLVGLSALLIYRQWRNPFVGERSSLTLPIIAGVLHGFNYFITIVEAATTPLGVPFAGLTVALLLLRGRPHLRQPVVLFFLVSYAVACAFFLGWGLYWGSLPEFSKVGIIE
jgi:hypothetical protein